MPQISVIVPVYKVESWLPQCADSILGQTFSDFELLFADDGSTDRCGEICDEYALTDARVTVIHQGNGGLSAARNTGIDYAFATSPSEYLTFIDSDDVVYREYLHTLLSALLETDAPVSFVGYRTFTGPCEELSPTGSGETIALPPDSVYDRDTINRFAYSPISACMKLYAKKLFRDIRFPLGKWYEDRFTTYRVLFQCPKIAVADAQYYFYRTNPEGIMLSAWNLRCLDDFEAMLQQLQYFEEIGADIAYRFVILDCLSVLARQIGQLKGNSRYKHYRRAFRSVLKKLLRKYETPYGITRDNGYEWYKAAYPHRTDWYFRIRNLWRKTKKLLRKEK